MRFAKTLIYGAVFLFILYPFSVFADIQSYPSSWNYPGDGSANVSFGSNDMMFSHTATTSLAAITSFEPTLCRYLGTGAGTITLEVWYNGTTTPYGVVASSTISVNTIVPCIMSGAEAIGSTTIMALNTPVNAVAGDILYFKIIPSGVDGSLYMDSDNTATATHFPWYVSSTTGRYTYSGKQLDAFARLGSGVIAYTTAWESLGGYASSTMPECGLSHLGSCVTQAFLYAFYPSDEYVNAMKALTLASSSPFGYAYSIKDKFDILATTTSTTSPVLEVNLTSFMGSTTGSSSIKMGILSAKSLQSVLGTSIWDTLQMILGLGFWVGFGWYVYRRSTSIL